MSSLWQICRHTQSLVTTLTSWTDTRDPRQHSASHLLTRCCPLLHLYSNLAQFVVTQVIGGQRVMAKLLSVLLGMFAELVQKVCEAWLGFRVQSLTQNWFIVKLSLCPVTRALACGNPS